MSNFLADLEEIEGKSGISALSVSYISFAIFIDIYPSPRFNIKVSK